MNKRIKCKNCKYWRQSNIFRQGGSCLKLTELVALFATNIDQKDEFGSLNYIAVETRSTLNCIHATLD